MEGSFWKTLLVVIGAVSAADISPPPKKSWSFQEAAELGVHLYNRKAKGDFQFRLLEAFPPPRWDPHFKGNPDVAFTIKETTCQAKDQPDVPKCDFKENGLVKKCTANNYVEEPTPTAVVICKEVEKEKLHPKRVKRFKKFFRKARKGFRKVSKRIGKAFRKLRKKIPIAVGVSIPIQG